MASNDWWDDDYVGASPAPKSPKARKPPAASTEPEADWWTGTSQFDNVESDLSSTEDTPVLPEIEQGSFLERTLAIPERIWADNLTGRAGREVASLTAEEIEGLPLNSFMTEHEKRRMSEYGLPGPSQEELLRRQAERQAELPEEIADATARLRERSQRSESLEALLGEDTVYGRVTKALGGFASQAELQALPLVGGAVGSVGGPVGAILGSSAGSIPMAQTAYDSSLVEAYQDFGATKEEAQDYAAIMTAIEFAPSALGGAASGAITTAGARLGLKTFTKEAAEEALKRKIRSRTSRVAGAMLAEGVDEVVAGEGQLHARTAMAENNFFSDPEAQAKLKTKVAEDTANRWSDGLDNLLAGSVGGGITATPVSIAAYSSEVGQRTAAQNKATIDGLLREVAGNQPEVVETDLNDTSIDTTPTPQAAPVVPLSPQEQFEADVAAEQAKLEAPPTPEVVETAETTPEVVEAPVTPAPTTEPAVDPAEAKQRNSELGKIHAAKRAAGLDDAAYRTVLKDLTGKESAKDLSTEERATVLKHFEKAPRVAPKPGSAAAEIENLAKSLGIEVLSQAPAGTNTQPTPAQKLSDAYFTMVDKINRSLTKGNTQADLDVGQLVRDDKMIIAPNPTFLGRQATDGDSAAIYDIATGKMYLYTDHMDPDAPVRAETLAAAMHESSHGLQDTEREGRNNILEYMATPDKYQAVNAKIKASAKSGNKIAQAVVVAAMRAGKSALIKPNMSQAQIDAVMNSPQFDAVVRGLEMVPYLATEVARARGKSLGSLSGAMTDLKAALRDFGRTKMGMKNLDFDINELMKASQQTAGEMTKTPDKRGRLAETMSGTLSMVGSKNAVHFDKAKAGGRTYKGLVDQKERFEFSDSLSTITNDEVALANLRAGEAMPLGEVLGHQSLYEQYPEAADIEVQVVEGLGAHAMFSPSRNAIQIDLTTMRLADAGDTTMLRSRVLHEVQHWIQDKEDLIPGFNDDLLIDPNVRAEKEAADTFMSNFLASVKPEDRVEFLPTNILKQWAALMESDAYPTDEAKARAFVDGMFAASSSNASVRALATRYRALNTAVIRADAAYKQQMDAAWDAYERDYGETEARNTELRSNISQEAMDASANPNPESSMQYAEFEVPVERTIRALDLVENPQQQAARKSTNKADNFDIAKKDAKEFNPSAYRPEVISWAQNTWRDMTAPNGRPVWQNFVEWFGESQVVNPDGTPMVLYHGTTSLENFEEFHAEYAQEIGTHVGTVAQANDPRFLGQIYGNTSPYKTNARIPDLLRSENMRPRLFPLFAKVENPLVIEDVFGLSPSSLLNAIRTELEQSDALTSRAMAAIEGAEAWFSSPEFARLDFMSEESYKQSWAKLRTMMEELGYDGFKYRNTAEGFRYSPGSGTPKQGVSDPASRLYHPLASEYAENSWVVMEPANLKSANNSGDFDGRQRKVLAQARRTQIAYHGTPNTFTNKDEKNPLGKFDEEFMSSGEGQQAVGYGFYFSGSHGVSDESYRRRLLRTHGEYAPPSGVELQAEYIFDMYSDVYRNLTDEMLASAATSMKADAAKLVARIQDNQKEYDNIPKVVDAYMASVHGREEATAMKAMDPRLYTEMSERFLILHEMDLRDSREILVEQLVDTESMLEFIDNSTAEQITEIYKKSFQTASASDGELYYVEIPADEDLADWNASYESQNSVTKAAMDEAVDEFGVNINNINFRTFYNILSIELGSDKATSRWLHARGVLGHKFQPIFGKKWDYHNYVVYEPTHARIVGRDAREKGQTRASMNEWVAEIQLRNKQKIESWVREVQEAREPTGVLSMAAAPVRERKQKKIPVMLRAAFSSSGSTSAEIRAIKEHAASSPSSVRMRAEAFMGQYKKALEKLAKKRGVPEQSLSDALTKAIDGIDSKSDLYDENLQAFKDAVRPFGEVGKVLVDFRGMVDNLSMDILRQRAASGKPLSAAEKKTYTTVLSNLGRYGHRQFAAHIRDGGFGEAVWDSYLRAKGKKKMTPEERANAKRVVNALTVLVDQITIPDKAKLNKLSEEKLDKLFATWSDSRNHEALTHDEKREQLDAMRDAINGDGDAMMRQAERIAEEILGLHGKDVGPVASYYRGGKLDLGILQTRKVIDPRIRELMGEIKDPGMRLFTTAAKQSEFVARNKMLIEFTQVKNPYHIQPPGPSGRASVKGMKQLQGEGFGAMEHYWVSPEFFNLISDQVEQLATFEQAVAMAAARPQIITNKAVLKALDVWAGIAGTTKMLQIIGKPVNFLFNLGGGGRMMLMNGNINPVTLGRAVVTAGELVAYAIDPSKGGERAQRVNAMGITDSAFIGEISSEQYRELRKVIQSMVGQEPGKFKENLRKAGLSVKETYAMMDVVYKIANFYHQADGVLPAFYKAEGIKKTQEEIDREAADIVSRTNITYKRAAPVIKALERGGITMFGTYFYEVFRTEVENARQGVAELVKANNAKTVKGKAIMGMQAAKRLGGQLTAWGLTYGASQMLADIAFGEEEDDWYARFLMPEFARAKDFIVAGKTKEGIPVLMDWSRFDPAGPASDIMRRIVNGNADPKEVAKEIFGLYIAPRIGTRLALAAATSIGLDWGNPPDPVVEQVFPEAYADAVLEPVHSIGVPIRVTRAWTTVGESFLPGFIDGFKKSNPKLAETDPYHAIQAVARAGGLYFNKLDPAPAVRSAAYDYKTTTEMERRLLGELVGSFPNLTEATVLRQLTSARTKEFKVFTDLRNVYRGMQVVGMDEGAIRDLLKTSKISGDVISQLESGEFESSIVSEKSWKAYKASAMNKATSDEEREELETKWDNAWEILQGVGSDD